jgi:hypothetical protein
VVRKVLEKKSGLVFGSAFLKELTYANAILDPTLTSPLTIPRRVEITHRAVTSLASTEKAEFGAAIRRFMANVSSGLEELVFKVDGYVTSTLEWEGVDWFGDEVKSLPKLRSLDFDFSVREEGDYGNGYVGGRDGGLPNPYRELGKKILKLAPHLETVKCRTEPCGWWPVNLLRFLPPSLKQLEINMGYLVDPYKGRGPIALPSLTSLTLLLPSPVLASEFYNICGPVSSSILIQLKFRISN